ncbi:MAG: ribosome silencing factor [Nitrospira sp.]|nr:ribosome silencing factor [Nitrospira sp.]
MALEKKASDVMVLHTADLTSIADYLVIGSGNSERHVKAIAEAIRRGVSHRFGERGTREGETAGTWILIDYGDIVVHIFREDIRMYYAVEKMWSDAPQIPQTEYAIATEPLSGPHPSAPVPASVNAWHGAS